VWCGLPHGVAGVAATHWVVNIGHVVVGQLHTHNASSSAFVLGRGVLVWSCFGGVAVAWWAAVAVSCVAAGWGRPGKR